MLNVTCASSIVRNPSSRRQNMNRIIMLTPMTMSGVSMERLATFIHSPLPNLPIEWMPMAPIVPRIVARIAASTATASVTYSALRMSLS